ncbi:hypothetical protein [Hoeflea alexandrii]|uniref:hypothetical protein n=1 Tax=Hoeflea alexandrii TaxID=288436 RepID=UPI003CCE4E70
MEQIRAEEAAGHLARLPIIVLTADGQASTRDDLLAAGADGHAEKPVDPEWLLQLVTMTARQESARCGLRSVSQTSLHLKVSKGFHRIGLAGTQYDLQITTCGMANVTRMSQNHG